jgi:phage terminase large subunit-like protein
LPEPTESPAVESPAVRASLNPKAARALASLTPSEAALLQYDWSFWARPSQMPPDSDWSIWLLLTGRGFGKTRAGSQWVIEQAKKPSTRIAMVGRIPADARDVMINGESGVLASSPPDFRPIYTPSKRLLTWPNKSEAHVYSSETPDDLRGPNFHCAWVDELAKFRFAQETWDTLVMSVRLPPDPRIVITTTPRPIPLVKQLITEKTTHVTTGTTFENQTNLSGKFFDRLITRYEGTYLGKQELEGRLISDRPGALWTREVLEQCRVKTVPDLSQVVVAIDPPATAGTESAEAGIVVVGRGTDQCCYVLMDASRHSTPDEWGKHAVRMYDQFKASSVVAETNQGGDMVGFTLRECAKALHRDGQRVNDVVPYTPVHASRGKFTRAEPVAALYSQGRVKHLGLFADLEDQLTSWVPGEKSPDRLDALVWGVTFTMLIGNDLRAWGGIEPRPAATEVAETAVREGAWFPNARR